MCENGLYLRLHYLTKLLVVSVFQATPEVQGGVVQSTGSVKYAGQQTRALTGIPPYPTHHLQS